MILLAGVVATGCARAPLARTDTPEPAAAPPESIRPAGRLVAIPGGGDPEGSVVDPSTNTLAVALRHPDGVALFDLPAAGLRRTVALDGAPRHLQLATPGGPLIAPAEGSDHLFLIDLPRGDVEPAVQVGRQPHDAAPAGGAVFVGDELADTVHIVRGSESTVVGAPVQPGGVATSGDGRNVFVVGVRGREIEQITAGGRIVGRARCGVGPTHVRSARNGLTYVADTQGDALLVFAAGSHGPRQVGRIHTGGRPYGLAVDSRRHEVFVTLTATNQLRSFHIEGRRLRAGHTWATARQPNDVAVDERSGQVIVTGTSASVLELIDPTR
ncbi:MAG: hypothetical protein NVSMB16_13270 [Acidimicrobiales bacterium]